MIQEATAEEEGMSMYDRELPSSDPEEVVKRTREMGRAYSMILIVRPPGDREEQVRLIT